MKHAFASQEGKMNTPAIEEEKKHGSELIDRSLKVGVEGHVIINNVAVITIDSPIENFNQS